MAELPPIVSYDGVSAKPSVDEVAATANRLNIGMSNVIVDIPVKAGETSTEFMDERFGPHRVVLIPAGCPVTYIEMQVGEAYVEFPAAPNDGIVSVVILG